MSDETPITKPLAVRKRRWLRFSLRTLLLVVTVLCVWLGWRINAARQQKEAVDAILKAGGTVHYDYQILPNIPSENHWNIGFNANALPTGPPLLRKLFGDDCFRKVILVNFSKTDLPESVLTQLTKLPDITHVALQSVNIIPDGSNVPRPIQDADFEVFGQLSRLEYLDIYPADIDGSGLAQLTKLKDLRALSLQHTTIGDAGMEIAGALTQLELLQLDHTPITDEGLKHLKRLVNLKSLWLQEDQGITDAGLQYLSGLKNLKAIHLYQNQVTPEGVRELQKSLPNTKITGIRLQ